MTGAMGSSTATTLPDCILTVYPLTRAFQSLLNETTGSDAITLRVADLRQHGIKAMMRRLRERRVERVLLPLEDGDGIALLPVLKILASLIPSRGIYVIDANMQMSRIGREQVAMSGL